MSTSFAVQLKAFADKTKGRRDQVVRKVVFEIGSSLVFKSPVGDASYWLSPAPKGYVGGRFRANWQLGVGAINFTVTEGVDPGGDDTVGRLFTVLADEAPNQVFYLTNSLAYGPPLEDGHSRQAPHGMVKLTVVEFRQFVASVVSEVKQNEQ